MKVRVLKWTAIGMRDKGIGEYVEKRYFDELERNAAKEPTVTFEATDELLKQLHDAYAALTRKMKPSTERRYSQLQNMILAVGKAVNVEALNPRETPEEKRQIEADMRADRGIPKTRKPASPKRHTARKK